MSYPPKLATALGPWALAGLTGVISCTGSTRAPSSPSQDREAHGQRLVPEVASQDVRETARLTEAASWLAKIRQGEAVLQKSQPRVFEVMAAMDAVGGIGFSRFSPQDLKPLVKDDVMDHDTAERVEGLRSRLFESAIERATEEAQAYINGQKSCDLSQPYDREADLLATETGPCTTTYLRKLLATLNILLRADDATRKVVFITPDAKSGEAGGICFRDEWAVGGSKHGEQLVPAFIGLSNMLNYWEVGCSYAHTESAKQFVWQESPQQFVSQSRATQTSSQTRASSYAHAEHAQQFVSQSRATQSSSTTPPKQP